MEISRKQKRMPLPSCRHSSAKKKRKDGNDNAGHDTRPKARTTSASVQTKGRNSSWDVVHVYY